MGKIEAKQSEVKENEQAVTAVQQPVLIIAVGRQRVGKTTLLNALVEMYRTAGANLDVWNADLQNRTHSISAFHSDALQPEEGATIEEQREWIERRVRDQVRHRRDAVLDVGGGFTALGHLVAEVKLVATLERNGVRPVLMYVMGNEPADVDYLEKFAEQGMFMPAATLIVFNSGLLTGGRTAKTAFGVVSGHPAIAAAVHRGAVVMTMPALGCIAAVSSRGQSFGNFAAGKQVPGHEESSFFDHERVWLWRYRDMPRFFLKAPAEWLPALAQPLTVQEG